MDERIQVLPEKFLAKLPLFIPEKKLESVLHSFTERRLPTIRVNTLKTTNEVIRQSLTEQGHNVEVVSWYKDAFVITNKSTHDLVETPEYKRGEIYIQNLSSMIPALILNPQPTDRVLDICAAPGSKTTQIAAHMHNEGEIIANDISKDRLYRLRENLAEQGVTNTKVTSIPGEFLWKRYPEYFDKVLLDAPCSMEGLFITDNPKTYTHWTSGKVKQLAVKQQHLLRSAISATIPGGVIIYSTCTLSPEENEGVIEWILKKEGSAIVLEQLQLTELPLISGFSEYKNYSSQVTKTGRILPSNTMEGFFVAKIRKISSTITKDSFTSHKK